MTKKIQGSQPVENTGIYFTHVSDGSVVSTIRNDSRDQTVP